MTDDDQHAGRESLSELETVEERDAAIERVAQYFAEQEWRFARAKRRLHRLRFRRYATILAIAIVACSLTAQGALLLWTWLQVP